jgi:RNA polymerase sigma factor (sigma-70 family)
MMEIDMSDKEYRLEIRVRNNTVLKRIEQLGYDSIPAFCRDKGLPYHLVNEIIAFKLPFYGKRGNISGSIIKLADALNMLPDHIYPPERRGKPLTQNKYIVESRGVDLMQVANSLRADSLPPDERKMLDDFAPTIQLLLNELTPRQKEVLERRFGLIDGYEETLDDVGAALGVGRERIRQIEAKAMRRMRHPDRSRNLREYLETLNEVGSR